MVVSECKSWRSNNIKRQLKSSREELNLRKNNFIELVDSVRSLEFNDVHLYDKFFSYEKSLRAEARAESKMIGLEFKRG